MIYGSFSFSRKGNKEMKVYKIRSTPIQSTMGNWIGYDKATQIFKI